MTMWLGAPNTIHVASESIQTIEMEILDKKNIQLEEKKKEGPISSTPVPGTP